MRAVFLVVLLAVSTALSGCAGLNDLMGGLNRPDVSVHRTGWKSGQWTNEPVFSVAINEVAAHEVSIKATEGGGAVLRNNGTTRASGEPIDLKLPDGVWTVVYHVDGFKWETIRGVKLDTVAPSIVGLSPVADAPSGSFLLGAGASVTGGFTLNVTSQDTGLSLGQNLPVQLAGLTDGVHAYDVVATDEAGNVAIVTVQVRVGDALFLPAGQHTLGIVARYTQELGLWDLKNQNVYLSRSQAQTAVQNAFPDDADGYLGAGNGIEPNDPLVRAAVAQAVQASDNAMQAALALFEWLADNTEYDQARRDSNESGLLSPATTLERGQGVCRDLAALYVSLLRAAGVPSRLVTGYVGSANVGGFHAWVEFYAGGNGPSPWVTVDVSFDGDSDPGTIVQFFAIRPIGNLPMMALNEAQEEGEWFIASQASYRAARAPNLEFADILTRAYETLRALCFDGNTLERRISSSADRGCAGMSRYFPGFKTAGETVLDYGMVIDATGSTDVTLGLAFPTRNGDVEMQSYGASFRFDDASGVATATWKG